MDINNPQTFDHIEEYGGNIMKMYVMDIGDWNMDTTARVDQTHPLTLANIRAVQVYVRSDSGSSVYPLDFARVEQASPADEPQGRWWLYNDEIRVERRTGGFFDSASYSTTPYNRGWIVFWYED